MSPDRLGRIDELYHAALERQPGERDVFLASACQGDADLREEVASRLAQNPLRRQALAPGAQLGPYRIIGVAGTGGQGEVYRASDSRLRRDVAIKVLPEHLAKDPHARARFEYEARAIAALNDPHICQIFDVGPDYLVMEFVDGAPLKGPLPLNKAVEYAGQILDALDAAHRKGITHRDLKPGNILLTKNGIKLLDFGLAKQSSPLKETDGTLTMPLTGQGQIVGTPQYMSPEQLHGKEADARSDLFSFGCVLYEMLTGRRAFDGQSAASVTAAILEREPAPLDVPPPLERVIRTCLAKDPDQRFQNALDLKRALTWALEQQPSDQPRRSWWFATALAFVAAGALGVAYLRQPVGEGPSFRLQVAPPPGMAVTSAFAVSRDGRTLTFVAESEGKNSLWVRPLDSLAARALPGTDGADLPFWSPDGKSIAFFANGKLKRIEIAGGPPQVLCDALSTGRGGAWSSEGVIAFATSASYGLMRVAASGGTPAPLTTPATGQESLHRWPHFLPDGRRFLFMVVGQDNAIYASSLENPHERVRIVSSPFASYVPPYAGRPGYLLWVREGALVAQRFDLGHLRLEGDTETIVEQVGVSTPVVGQTAISASERGVLIYNIEGGDKRQITWVGRDGKAIAAEGPPDSYLSPRLSPDGHSLAVGRATLGVSNIWLYKFDRALMTRLTFNPFLEYYPQWSPDGHWVAFSSRINGVLNLYRKSTTGEGEEERLTQSLHLHIPASWSRDGRYLLYTDLDPQTQFDLWVLPLDGDRRPRPFSEDTV